MASDFEDKVLDKLEAIKVSVGRLEESNLGRDRRIELLEKHNDKEDNRQWIKSLVVGAAVIIGHPLARKLGLDI